MKRIILLFLLASLFVFPQCKKNKQTPAPDNPYGLPNATQTGANIFACRVNGVNWISNTGMYVIAGGYAKDTLTATGGNGGTNYFERFTLRIDGTAEQGGIYSLNSISDADFFISSNKSCLCPAGGCGVFNSYAVSGQITITKIDSVGSINNTKIVSGLFNCKIPIDQCDTLNITDGRFDIRYF